MERRSLNVTSILCRSDESRKPLSVAVSELEQGKIHILNDEEE